MGTPTTVNLATADQDLGLVPAKTAAKHAQEVANETGKAVTVRHATTDKVLRTVKPKKANGKAKPAAKAKSKAKAKPAAKSAKPKGERKPGGMVVKILALASRPMGVTPAELNKLTEWKGAPWKWLFANPKKTGYCDRWGYKFKVTQGDEGETRYCATAKADKD
jgi:hypothetical protein